jgi:hypothetical protein
MRLKPNKINVLSTRTTKRDKFSSGLFPLIFFMKGVQIIMATTWIKPIHKAKGRSVAATLADRIGYADNPDKTNGYEFVKSYGCDYYTAANEFAMSKTLYEQQTGCVFLCIRAPIPVTSGHRFRRIKQ